MPIIITLQSIAKELHLAKSTVSLALNNDPRIRKETRARVQAMAQKMGYRPNLAVSDLASLRWKSDKLSNITIGFIREVLNSNIGPYEEASTGIHRQAKALGYQVENFYLSDFSDSLSLQKLLIAKGIHNLIIGAIYHETMTLSLSWDRFVAVSFPVGFLRLPLHAVVSNHYSNVVLAWEKAVEYGYQRIGALLISHEIRFIDDDLRFAAVLNCQKKFSPKLPSIPHIETLFSDDFMRPTFLRRAGQWIKKHNIDVIIGFHGGLYYAIKELSKNPVGFINLHLPLHSDGSETYAQAGIEDVNRFAGAEAVNLLHLCRKTNEWGIPSRRFELVIDSKWRDGNTLPRLIRS